MARNQRANLLLILVATRLGQTLEATSPIPWSKLSNEALAGCLRAVADWTRTDEARHFPESVALQDSCLDLAEQMERRRETGRQGRDR